MCNFSEAAATNVKATAAGAEVASNCSHLPHTLRKVPTHSVVKQEIHSHRENFSWNQLCSNFTVWKSRQNYDHDFYGKMKIFSVKSTQKLTIC